MAAVTRTVEPSFNYGGSSGNLNYFVSGDFLHNDLGIESPDGSSILCMTIPLSITASLILIHSQ